jgi:hypothetical protein
MDSATAQFQWAMAEGSERSFQAVLSCFPPAAAPENELYGNKAKLQLAYLYENSDRLLDALQFYHELATQDGCDPAGAQISGFF